jgi:hypothetical protein
MGPPQPPRAPAAQVTVEDIEELEGSFRGSPEEAAELLDLHERFAGDMPRVSGAPVWRPAGGACLEDRRLSVQLSWRRNCILRIYSNQRRPCYWEPVAGGLLSLRRR